MVCYFILADPADVRLAFLTASSSLPFVGFLFEGSSLAGVPFISDPPGGIDSLQ